MKYKRVARYVRKSSLLILFSLALSSCFRPMYAEMNTAAGSDLRTVLASVSVEVPKDRIGQQISNNLSFKFTGGGEAPAPKYRLYLSTHASSETALVNGLDLTPKIETTTVACDFTLADMQSEKILLRAKVFGRKSYNSSLQRFATVRGQRGSENGVSETIADQIQIRLSTYFASHAA